MRRSSLWISSVVFMLLVSCQIGKKGQTQETESTKNGSKTQASNIDTLKSTTHDQDDLTWKERRQLRKDSKNEGKQIQEAPKHNAPNQAEIDSIKNAKAKLRGQ